MSAREAGHFEFGGGGAPTLTTTVRASFLLMAVCVALSGNFVIGRLFRLTLLVAIIILGCDYAIGALGRF